MDKLETIGKAVLDYYQSNCRVVSFQEYLAMVAEEPARHTRGAAQYLRDMFDHFGTEQVHSPGGEIRRFKLFDAPWEDGEDRLVGQERAQNAIYRIISNFARQGAVDRFILLHGPNGSSKSTITELLSRAMEHYSALPDGALYRFNWIFPTHEPGRGGIGFGGETTDKGAQDSYAYLEDSEIDARLICEMRDHPLLLIPQQQRAELLRGMLTAKGQDAEDLLLSEYLLGGNLCPKCKLVYESLLNAYQGDYLRVLKHVQVERFYVSRRYRLASTRVEPQLAVDAKSRQVTADRSLGALPTALQSIALFEYDGDLVQGNRGIIDYPDLLKRPIEAFKYLLTTVEDGHVVLDQTNLFFDMVFIGSSNDAHLNAFMESPDWMSFKGRMELVRVPYLLDYTTERSIYDNQIKVEQVGKHIAPHATTVASLWAALSRMHRPQLERYPEALRPLVSGLNPLQKVELYAEGKIPPAIKGDEAKTLLQAVPKIWAESDAEVIYEGRTGASPREVKTAIFNAAQNPTYGCLTPAAVLEELKRLVQETSFYPYLRMEPKEGYYDHRSFIEVAEQWYLDRADNDVRSATGLVDEASYAELFSRYVNHVIHYVRKERVKNPVTGAEEDPDESLMREVEKILDADGKSEDFRQGLLTKVGAWSVDHTGKKPDYLTIFPGYFEALRTNYFAQQKRRIIRILQDALVILSGEKVSLPEDRQRQAQQMIERMQGAGYCDYCAREAITLLVRTRYN